MAKFKIKVKIIAECEYTTEIEHESEAAAEREAIGQWRDKLPSNFQVSKSYITDWETEAEQLTAVCPECGVEHDVPTAAKPLAECWPEDPEYCAPCGAKIQEREKTNG